MVRWRILVDAAASRCAIYLVSGASKVVADPRSNELLCGNLLPVLLIRVFMDATRGDETVAFAELLGLVPCFTPVRSPESNGMAESFVKTFKRDYVYVHDRPDAKTVLTQLSNWFDDYNEYHPHKGLRMKSPREFIRAQQAAVCSI